MRPGPKVAVIVLAGLAGVLLVLVLIVLVLATMDWNRAKPWIAEQISEATGRSFAIEGDLWLDWQAADQGSGWSGWIPRPSLHAENVTLGNTPWATSGPVMARAEQIDLTVNLLPLLRKTVQLESLDLTRARVTLEQDRKDQNNWTFDFMTDEDDADWHFDLRSLVLRQGTLRYIDPGKQADITARANTPDDGSLELDLAGTFNAEKLSGRATTGGLLALRETGARYPFDARIAVGDTNIIADGTVTNPADPQAVELNLKLLGASMADLFPLSGVLLPETPKFSTEGRVTGTLAPGKLHLRYEKFKGKVGSSDLAGTLEYLQREPRALLRGDVVSNRLNFKDLGAVVGATDREKDKPGTVKQPPDKVLPVSPFKTDRWDKMDVAVQFSGKEVIRGDALPIDNLHTDIRMEDGRLSLTPLNFGVAGGKLVTELSINGRHDPARATMHITARGLKLRQMFPKVDAMRGSIGQMQAEAELSATGNSIATLLASANGEVRGLVSDGTVSKFVLEAIGLNVGSVIVTQLFGDKQVDLHCMAADFSVTDGVMKTQTFLLDTSDATIQINGDIDFKREVIDLAIHPESKGMRIFSLRSPLYARGTFQNPDVGVDKGAVAAKAGAAVVLGVAASPLAALLALINPGPTEDSPCAILEQQAKQTPQAPPPGKSTSRKQPDKK